MRRYGSAILRERRFLPLRAAIVYAVAGALWIVYSDRMLAAAVGDAALLTELQTLKGWLFVAVSAFVLYLLMRLAPPAAEDAAPAGSPVVGRAWRLRMQLLGLGLAIAVPLVAVVAYNIYREVEHDRREAGAAAFNLARAAAQNSETLLANARGILEVLAQRPAVRALDRKSCDALLADIPRLHPYFRNSFTVDRNGDLVCSTLALRPGTPRRPDPVYWFNRVRDSGRFTIGAPAVGFISGRWVVTLAQPLRGAGGEFIGAVGLSVDLVDYPVLPPTSGFPPEAVVGIASYAGTAIARSRDAKKFVGGSTRESPIRPAALGAANGQLEVTGMDGVARVYGFAAIAGSDWYAIAGIPAAAVYGDARASLARSVVLTLAVLLAVALLAYAAGRRIEQPLARIAAAAQAVAGGDPAVRAPETGAPEIAGVAREFNRMLEARALSDAELRESRERFRKIFYLAPMTAVITRLEDGRILELNDELCRILGYRREQLLGRTSIELGLWVDPKQREVFAARMAAAGRLENFEMQMRTASGEARDMLVSTERIEFLGEPSLLIIGADVTERRRAEEALRKSEQRLRLALSTGDVWDSNLLTGEKHFPTRMMRVLGYDDADAEIATTPAAFESLLHPDDREPWRNAMAAHLRDRTPYAFQYRARAKSGDYRWFEARAQADWDDDGRPVYIAGTVFDITARKQAELSALRLRQLYSASYETSSALLRLRTHDEVLDAACRIVVTHGGIALAWISLAEVSSGRLRLAAWHGEDGDAPPPDESFGPVALAHLENRQVMTDDLAAAAAPSAASADVLRRGYRAAAATPIERGGKVIGTLTVCAHEPGFFDAEAASLLRLVANDLGFVLELIEAEATTRRHSARLEILSRRLLEAHEAERSAIARELHDEIGQSLTALKLNLQAASRVAGSTSAAKLEQCVQIADRLLAQTRNLTLDLRPPQLDQLGLVAALRDALDRVAAQARLKSHFSAEPGDIAVEPGLATVVYRVAQEALTNAVRHAGARRVAIELRAARGELFLAVSDDGSGYDPEAARVRAIAGASTGLLGMEERVALAGGRLEILARPGQGTRVQAVFPLRAPAPAAAAGAA